MYMYSMRGEEQGDNSYRNGRLLKVENGCMIGLTYLLHHFPMSSRYHSNYVGDIPRVLGQCAEPACIVHQQYPSIEKEEMVLLDCDITYQGSIVINISL